jgi:hypothetical protein
MKSSSSSSSLKSLFVLLLLVLSAAPTMGTDARRLPFLGNTPPALTKSRFFKKQWSLSSSSISSPPLTVLESSSSVIAAPRCGASSTDLNRSRDNDNKKGTKNNNNDVVGDGTRFAILLVGWFLGYAFYFPNVMMADSETPRAIWASQTGVAASVLLALGGCIGYISTTIGWKALVPGAICQVLMFLVLGE